MSDSEKIELALVTIQNAIADMKAATQSIAISKYTMLPPNIQNLMEDLDNLSSKIASIV